MDSKIILTPVSIADLMQQIRAVVRDELQQQQTSELQEKLLTPKETADLLRISLVTLWEWEKQGRIVKYKMGGRTYFKYSEIMASFETLQRYKKPVLGRVAV
jgi:excisionase family DNA binding protein